MLTRKQPSSTNRRKTLALFIDEFGEAMVQKCTTCVKHDRVCRVHVRSGKCSECLRRGQRCNVRVTESEFRRLAAEKAKLKKQIQESRDAQESAFKAHEEALEKLRVARAREERLRQQMDLIDRRADEAISVEDRALRDLEEVEASGVLSVEEPSKGLALNLSPSTWSAFEGFPLEYWESSDLGDIAPIAGGSS